MFNIYLTNWIDERLQDNPMVSSEQLIMSIPFSEGEEPCMINPTIKEEMGKASSLDFTVNPGMKYYNAYQQLKTLIRIEYINPRIQNSNKTIFYGRVVTINTSNLLEIKSIHAEGAYATLADTQHEGIEEDLQVKKTAWQLFTEIVSSHNKDVGEEYWKVFSIGTVDSGILDNESKKRDPTSWSDSLSAIDQLINNYGGYMRARYDHTQSDPYKRLKLDWFRKYYRDLGDKRPYFQLAKNIIDLSSSDEISEVFTRVIPIGHKATTSSSYSSDSSGSTTRKKESSFIYLPKKWVSVTSAIPSQSELDANFQSIDEFVNAEAKYGIIYKTVNFQNADNTSKLSSYVDDWIKKNYYGALRSFTVKAVDMKMVNLDDNTDDMILAGDCVDISYPEFDQNGNRKMSPKTRLVCKSAQIVLFNPEQNVYGIGVPNDAIDFEYGQKKKATKASATVAATASAQRPTTSRSYDLTFKGAWQYLLWFYYGNNWGDVATAQKHYAYSWRCDGLLSRTDRRPADTFKANGQPASVYTEMDDVPEYDPAYPGDMSHATIVRKEVEKHNYFYVKVEGLENRKVRIMGHYTMSPVPKGFENGVTYPGYLINNGYTYGFGYVEGTDDAVAFSWSAYQSGQGQDIEGKPAIKALFHYPNLFGSHTSAADGNLDSIGTGADAQTTDETGAPAWINPETGEVNVKIFPEIGTIGAGYAYEYETNEDGSPVYNEDGTIKFKMDENGDPIVMTDPETGQPIWAVQLNAPITYYDDNNKPHTVPSGTLVVNDLKLPGIPSFMTNLAAINTAIIGKASIAQLRAITADIGNYDNVSDADFNTLFEVDYHYTDSSGNVVLPFSTKKSYQTGDRVGYNNKIYQFISNHSPGAWNSSQVVLIGDGTKVDNVDANGNKILKVKEGTRFANTNDQIQGVAGRFILNSDGSMSIMEGGGIDIKRGNASFGLWDEGKLSAGMFVTKDNGKTYTKIKGDYINIGDGNSEINLKETMSVSSQGTAVFHKPILLDGHQLIIKGSRSNANSQTNISGTGITLSGIGTITWPGQGPSGGEPAVSGGTLDREKVVNLINTSSVHVKITGPVSNKYTLWYLPASKVDNSGRDPSTAAGWINAGDFSRAASIKPIWSGSGAEGGTGQHLKLLAHPAGDENTELASYSIGFGQNFNQTNDKGLVQLNTGTPEYIEVGDIRSVSIPYTLDLMAGKVDNPEELVSSRTLYTNKKTFLLSTIPITTKPTVSFTETNADKLGPISGKATDVFGNISSSITFSVSRPVDPFQDQTSGGAIHRVMEFKYGSDVVGRYQVDDYWNGGGNSAYASSPVAISDPSDDERTAAGSALSYNTYYKYDVKYTNAAGNASTAVNTKYFLTPSESHSVSISDQHDTSSKQELQNIYGSTVTLDTAFSSEQLNKNSRFYGFKVKCGTSSKYYYFQTPSATQTIVTVGDWENYRLGWNASRNMIKRSGNSILRGKEMQAGATSAPTGYDTYTIASASVSGYKESQVKYVASSSSSYPGDNNLSYELGAGDSLKRVLWNNSYFHVKHFGSNSGTGVVSWTV